MPYPFWAWCTVLPQQPTQSRDPRHSLQSPNPTFQYATSSFRGRMICLHAIFHVILPACDSFSQHRRFVVSPQGTRQKFRCCHCHADCHLPLPRLAEIGPSRHKSAQIKAYSPYHRLHGAKELTKILVGHVIPWRSQAEASHVIVRHFLHWPGRNA